MDGQGGAIMQDRMRRYAASILVATLAGCAMPPPAPRAGLDRIDHIIVVYA